MKRPLPQFTPDDLDAANTGEYFEALPMSSAFHNLDTPTRFYAYTGVTEEAEQWLRELDHDHFLRRIYLGEV